MRLAKVRAAAKAAPQFADDGIADAMLRQSGDSGYKLIVINEGETPPDALVRSRLKNWPAGRII